MSKKRMDMPVEFIGWESSFRIALWWRQGRLKTIGPWFLMFDVGSGEVESVEHGHGGWRISRNWEVAT